MQGTVQYVNEKPWNGKVLYSFKLSNDDSLYMCGVSRPNVKKGDYVNFDVTVNPKGQQLVDAKTLKVAVPEIATGRSGGDSWKPPEDKRQRTIEWQAARNSAIAAADVILKNGALKLPAKESGKYDVVVALIMDLTKKFFEETHVLGEVKKAEKEAEQAISPEAEVVSTLESWDD